MVGGAVGDAGEDGLDFSVPADGEDGELVGGEAVGDEESGAGGGEVKEVDGEGRGVVA